MYKVILLYNIMILSQLVKYKVIRFTLKLFDVIIRNCLNPNLKWTDKKFSML